MSTRADVRASWVGVDVGTQSVRVLIVSETGELVGRGSAPLSSRRDGDRHEQDPADWWAALGTAARQAVADGDTTTIQGLALDATSGTVLLVDDAGAALTPGLMYDDVRARAEVTRVNDAGAEVWSRLGYQRMQPSWGLPKLLWLLANSGGSGRLAHQSDYLTARLVGRPVGTDLSSALKSGCDLLTETWPDEVMAALDVPGEALPSLVRPGTRLGAVSSEAAAHTGLPADTPIYAGMTDGCAAQLGAGVVSTGDWNCVLGTTLVMKGVSDQIVADSSGAVYSHRAPDGRWLPGGASSSGAGAIARELPNRDLDSLALEAQRYEPSAVLTYPLAGRRGERFPFVAPDAEPFQVGQPSDDADQYASLTQGIAFVERLCFDHLDRLGAPIQGRKVLSGGAAKSAYFSQLRADVLGQPVTLTEHNEGGIGMAVLAAASEAGLKQAASTMVRETRVLEPRTSVHARFHEPYLRFVDELHGRGWIDDQLADHARASSSKRADA